MDFEFDCWCCKETSAVNCEPKEFLTVHYELPLRWNCYWCDEVNITPDD